MHRATAARARGVLGRDHHLDARQMRRQRRARLGALPGPRRLERRIVLLVLGLELGDRLLEVLEGELQLVGIELFRALPAPELGAPQLVQEVTQLVVLLDQAIALGDGAADQRAQRFDVVGKGIGHRAHKPSNHEFASVSAAIHPASRYAAIPSSEIRGDPHCTAFGRMIRGTCTRDQSSPSSEGLQEYPLW